MSPALVYPFPTLFVRENYSDYCLLSHLSEEAVQGQIVKAIHDLGLVVWPVDVGAKKVRGRACFALRGAGVVNPAVLLRSKHRGLSDAVQGFPDLPGVIPASRAINGMFGIPFYIEVKAPCWLGMSKAKNGRLIQDKAAGEPTPEQLVFLTEAHAAGALVGVAWSVADAIKILQRGLRDVA